MTEQEQARLQAMNLVLEGRIGVREAARVMGLGERQSWRILSRHTGKRVPLPSPTETADVAIPAQSGHVVTC